MRGLCVLLAGVLLVAAPPAARAAGIGPEFNGLGSFGASLGVMRWLADGDARSWEGHAAQIRPIGKAVFRYRVDSRWAVAVETGFGWNSYAESRYLVTWVIPTTVGVERRLRDVGGMTTSLTAGVGFYNWGRRRSGNYLQDPITHKALHAVDPGAYAGLAAETTLGAHVTLAAQLGMHFMYSLHEDDFPGVLGGHDAFGDLRLGLNYYFSPYEGLIWGGAAEE